MMLPWPGSSTARDFRAIFLQRPVGAMVMIIAKVVREPLSQVVLVEHDHMLEAFAADGSDQALDEGILPG